MVAVFSFGTIKQGNYLHCVCPFNEFKFDIG